MNRGFIAGESVNCPNGQSGWGTEATARERKVHSAVGPDLRLDWSCAAGQSINRIG